MKTLFPLLKKKYTSAGLGLLGLLLVSCGASKQTASNDGIYGDQQKNTATATTSSGNGYKQYFQSLREDEVFTDVNEYSSVQDTIAQNQNQSYSTGNASWGSETDQVVVNVYGNNWGYNYWNNYWYSPYWGYSWGWNWGWGGFYGPYWGGGWYGGWGYGYPYYGYGYGYGNYYQPSYNQGIRGGRGDSYNAGGRNSLSRYSTPSRGRQSAAYVNTGGRNSIYSNTAGRTGRTYTTTSTRQYTPGRNNSSSSRGFSPVYSNSGRNNSSYTPSNSGRGSSNSSYTPSRSSGGSYGGGGYGGGRSGGGGGGGGRSGGGGGGRR
ncbi:hypothetical protein [Flavobacterium silvaticum]|uniref:Prolyl-tRNA synthetase n=1 Tax=Flavobacterium silvaticum TaxID=1852020 RepID=A0A972FVB4_9FLAO|nr:hypothetical protein [Flavobacterium silvaticum]NMH29258.1 hypothetical protein [Flavobacterium silvaticum]